MPSSFLMRPLLNGGTFGGPMRELARQPPRGIFATFTSLRDAEAFQNSVNRSLGLPKPGVFVGGGRHTPLRSAGWTFTHAQLLVLPSVKRWAHLVDDAVAKLIRRGKVPPPKARAAPLSLDWADAETVSFAIRAEGALLKSFLSSSPRLPRITASTRFAESGSLLAEELKASLGSAPQQFLQLSPREFEIAVAEVLLALGCAVFVGPGTRDGGVDVVAASIRDVTPSILLVQCKCHRDEPVGESAVKALLADVLRYNATSGLLATTKDFTAPARALAAEYGWRLTLWSGNDLYTHFRAHIVEGHP